MKGTLVIITRARRVREILPLAIFAKIKATTLLTSLGPNYGTPIVTGEDGKT